MDEEKKPFEQWLEKNDQIWVAAIKQHAKWIAGRETTKAELDAQLFAVKNIEVRA